MKKIEAPYLLFALVFGFMALIAPYLMEEHRLTFEGRVAMFLFQAGMVFACSLATAKHLHDKWVQDDINDRQARLRMPKPVEDTEEASDAPVNPALTPESGDVASEGVADTTPTTPHHDSSASPASGAETAAKPPAA